MCILYCLYPILQINIKKMEIKLFNCLQVLFTFLSVSATEEVRIKLLYSTPWCLLLGLSKS